MLELSRIVDIRQKIPEAEQLSVGSGYQVGSKHILTARHVIHDLRAEVAVRIGASAAIKSMAKVVWASEPLDACILELIDADDQGAVRAIRWGKFDETSPGACESVGFPAASIIDERREPTPFDGELAFVPNTRGLQAILESPPDRGKLRGFSGAAVFIDGFLVGIVTEALEHFEDRIYVRPITALAEDGRFCELLGIDELEEISGPPVESVDPELTVDSSLCFDREQLREVFKQTCRVDHSAKLAMVPVIGEAFDGHENFIRFCESWIRAQAIERGASVAASILRWPARGMEDERRGILSETLARATRGCAPDSHLLLRVCAEEFDQSPPLLRWFLDLLRESSRGGQLTVFVELYARPKLRYPRHAWHLWQFIRTLNDYSEKHGLACPEALRLTPLEQDQAILAIQSTGSRRGIQIPEADALRMFKVSGGRVSVLVESVRGYVQSRTPRHASDEVERG